MLVLDLSGWLIALATAWALFLVLILVTSVEVRVAVRRHDAPARVILEVRLLLFKLKWTFNAERLLRTRIRTMVDRALVHIRGGEEPGAVSIGDAGEPSGETPDKLGTDRTMAPDPLNAARDAVARPGRTAVDKSRIRLWLELVSQARRATGPPTTYLRRRIQCRRLMLHMELGTGDAMQTALLCGSAWAAAGNTAALAGGLVRLEPGAPDFRIQPNFHKECLRLRVECILRFRTAHAIIAAVWYVARFMREKGLVAWMRDRRFRKGVVQDGRSPDSGSDEDGYGDAQDNGRRQHGGR